MDRYVTQLIEDLSNAEAAQIAIRSHLDILGEGEVFESESDEDEFYDCSKTAPLFQVIGFQKELFPPSEKLNDLQLELIYVHLLRVLDNFNFFLDFPDKVSSRVKYEMLLSIFDDDVTCSNAFVTNIEFCDYDYDTCPFGIELCQCKMYEDLG
ncbi:MAG TPA: hypothetical protein VKY37_06935 [Brumimicrobium sp.]|nr:hypothetical protein [Brumimicrobium sp.]